MKFICLVIILYAMKSVCGETTTEDVVVITDYVWRNLFFKLNSMVEDNGKLNEGLLDLNKRFEVLSKRHDQGNNDYNWRNLFLKFNIMIDETEKLNQGLVDLKKGFQILNKRQDDPMKLMQNGTQIQEEFSDWPEEQPNCMVKLAEEVSVIRQELNEKHDKILKNFQDIRDEFTAMNPNGPISSQTSEEPNHLTTELDLLMKEVPEIRVNAYNSHKWTTILRRTSGHVRFHRNWEEYREGFGSPYGDYFIGLEILHNITTYGPPQELMVIMRTYLNGSVTHYAKYDQFRIDGESEKYALKELGTYSGNAGDSLGYHKGSKFSTRDQNNNDKNNWDCSRYYEAGWWFAAPDCYETVLTGHFLTNDRENYSRIYRGINWNTLGADQYLIYAEMLIRPKS